MDWKDVGKTIATTGASILGNVVAGEMGASTARSLVATLFGADPDIPEDVVSKMTLDPDHAVKLRDLELTHKVDMEKILLERDRMQLQDIASARARETTIVQATGKKDVNLYVLAWVVTGGFLGLLMALIVLQIVYNNVSFSNNPLITMLLGALSSNFGMVVSYFFGSSTGSVAKTNIMAAAMGKKENKE